MKMEPMGLFGKIAEMFSLYSKCVPFTFISYQFKCRRTGSVYYCSVIVLRSNEINNLCL